MQQKQEHLEVNRRCSYTVQEDGANQAHVSVLTIHAESGVLCGAHHIHTMILRWKVTSKLRDWFTYVLWIPPCADLFDLPTTIQIHPEQESQSWIPWWMTLLFCSERRLIGKKYIRYQVFKTEWYIETSYSTSWIAQGTTMLHGNRSTL